MYREVICFWFGSPEPFCSRRHRNIFTDQLINRFNVLVCVGHHLKQPHQVTVAMRSDVSQFQQEHFNAGYKEHQAARLISAIFLPFCYHGNLLGCPSAGCLVWDVVSAFPASGLTQ